MSTDPHRLQTLYGTPALPPVARHFAIGSLDFDLIDGNLRTIRFDGIEVIRAIQYLMRDRDWGTVSPTLRDLDVIEDAGGIGIRYTADCTGPDGARLTCDASIIARDDGLDFTVKARAIDAVTVNRLGFCILHPAGLAGAPLRVEHGDGTMTSACFPELIDPWQPFIDIRAMVHQQHGITVSCRIDGDICEMEDQRNWSDASFKTYTRPLARPWPYGIPAGSIDRQSVRLRCAGAAVRPVARLGPVEIAIGPPVGTMPRIGLVLTPAETDAFAANRAALLDLGVQDLLLSFEAHAGHGAAEMQALARAVASLPHRLTLECVIAARGDLDAELGRIADDVRDAGLPLDAIAAYPAPDLQSTPPGSRWPDCPPAGAIRAATRRAFPGLRTGGGTYSYFTELNRKRPPPGDDFISHATCPIVHAADDLSVMQSLQAIPPILRSARAIIGDTPYRLGPVTIGMRQNPYGTRTMPNPDRARRPMAMVDPRQDGAFAAAWTIGHAAATEGASLEVLTFGELTGPLGLIGDTGRRPLFAAVAALAKCAGAARHGCIASRPDAVAAVATAAVVVMANLTADAVAVRVDGTDVALAAFEVLRIPRVSGEQAAP